MTQVLIPEPAAVTGVILAGGRGLRMGGVNKGLVEHQGRSLVLHAAELLRPYCDGLLVITNSDQEAYADLGLATTDDGEHAHEGPLAGLLAALRNVATDWIAVAPCDAVACDSTLYPRLLEAAAGSHGRVACARDEQYLQPAFCVVSQALMPALEHALAQGERALGRWMQEHDAVEVQSPAGSFSNLNTRDHLDPA